MDIGTFDINKITPKTLWKLEWSDEWEKKIEFSLNEKDSMSYLAFMEEWFLDSLKNINAKWEQDIFTEEKEDTFLDLFADTQKSILWISNMCNNMILYAELTEVNERKFENLWFQLNESIRNLRNNSAFEIHNLITEAKLMHTHIWF